MIPKMVISSRGEMELHEKILQLAEERHIGLMKLAEMAEIPYTTFKRQLSPGSTALPDARQGIALAKALGVSVEWLFDATAGFPAVPYHSPPPHRIAPWPPEIITWEQLQIGALSIAILETERKLKRYNLKALLGYDRTGYDPRNMLPPRGHEATKIHVLGQILGADRDMLQRLHELAAEHKRGK